MKRHLWLWLLAVIFYWQATGAIYGVHSDLATAPPVPEGVVHVEVPGTPDKIPWPVPAGQPAGREQWSRVNLTTQTIELRPDVEIPVNHDAELRQAIEAATTLQELKDALTGKTRSGAVKGRAP